jgi:hypothetical protein
MPSFDTGSTCLERPPCSLVSPVQKGLALWPYALVLATAFISAWYTHAGHIKRSAGADIVASIGARSITRNELDEAVAQVIADLQPRLSPQVRSEVLEKLVDEELLFREGMALRLPEEDPVLRNRVVRTMLTLARMPRPGARDEAAGRVQVVDRYVDWLRDRATVRVEGLP